MTAKPYHLSCVRYVDAESTNRESAPWLARWIEGFHCIGTGIVAPRTLRQLTGSDTAVRLGELVVTLGEILGGAVAARAWGRMKDSLDPNVDRYGIRSWPPDRAPRSRVSGVVALHQPRGIVAVVNATSDYATNRGAIERLVDLLLCDALARLHRRLQPTEAAQPLPGPVSGPPTRGTYRTAWQFRHLITVLEALTGILGLSDGQDDLEGES